MHKDPEANRAHRIELFEAGAGDQALYKWAVTQRCPQACALWLNLFGATYRQQEIDTETGKQKGVTDRGVSIPFVTWPCQDYAIRDICYAVWEGTDLVVDKSRQMGVTWLIASVFTWMAATQPDMAFICMSITEDLVDQPDDPFSIFWKLDHLIGNQDACLWMPPWMKPKVERTHLRLSFPETNSRVIGRSTTGRKGRGGACNAVLLDEAAEMEVLEALWTSFGQSTSCRIANSTPKGPVYYSKLVTEARYPVLRMPWWDHPEKGRGRRVAYNEADDEHYVRSPWYDKQVEREGGDRKCLAIAQELDMDHSSSNRILIEARTIARHLAQNAWLPDWRGEMRWEKEAEDGVLSRGDLRKIRFKFDEDGLIGARIKIWSDLYLWKPEDALAGGRGWENYWRLPQDRVYAIGADVALGTGASDSAFVVIDVERMDQVAEFACPNTSPERFARMLMAFGWWCGGSRGVPFLCVEANGPGGSCIQELMRLGYPWLYVMRDERHARSSKRRTTLAGWHSNTQRKLDLFGLTRQGLNRDEVTFHSRPLLSQLGSYVVYSKRVDVGPGHLQDSDSGARATHGDVAMAGALAYYAAIQCPRTKPPTVVYRKGSAAWRRQQLAKQRRAG